MSKDDFLSLQISEEEVLQASHLKHIKFKRITALKEMTSASDIKPSESITISHCEWNAVE